MIASWFASLAIAVSAATAVACDTTAYTLLNLPDEQPSTTLAAPPVGRVRVGDLDLVFEKTTLHEVAVRFGGATRKGGDAGGGATWLCYVVDHPGRMRTVFWFISNNEMGGGTVVTQVAEQSNLANIPKFCAAPKAPLSLDIGPPTIGSSFKAVERYFRSKHQAASGYLYFDNIRAYRASKDFTTAQTLRYHFAGGVIDAVSIAQVSSN